MGSEKLIETKEVSAEAEALLAGIVALVERAVTPGTQITGKISYDIHEGEFSDLQVRLRRPESGPDKWHNIRRGLPGGLPTKPDEDLIADIEDKAEQLPNEMFPYGFESEQGAYGEILFKKVGTNLVVAWTHNDRTIIEVEDRKAVLNRKRWEEIAKWFPALGVAQLRITYQGSDGYIHDVKFEFSDGSRVLNVNRGSPEGLAIERAYDRMISGGQVDGFWNKVGGRGEIVIFMDEATSYWNHWNYRPDLSTTKACFEVALAPQPSLREWYLIPGGVSDPLWS